MNLSDPAGSVASILGTFISTPAVQTAIRLVVLGLAIAWGVTLVWAWRDAAARSRNPLVIVGAAIAVLAATPAGFPLAIALWMLIRPGLTIAEAEEQRLTIAALEAEAGRHPCPGCLSKTNPEWRRCPRCETWLRARCPRCDRTVELGASICPWCAMDLPPGTLRPPASAPALVPVMEPRPVPAPAAPPFPPALAGLMSPVGRRGREAGHPRTANPTPRARRQPG